MCVCAFETSKQRDANANNNINWMSVFGGLEGGGLDGRPERVVLGGFVGRIEHNGCVQKHKRQSPIKGEKPRGRRMYVAKHRVV